MRLKADLNEALRTACSEVLVMRRTIEALPRAWAENQSPDYNPDVGHVVKGLNEIAARL